jgi:heme-degrading monooxygenase HmoA
MILEVAILNIRAGWGREFEAAFAEAAPIISSMPGYIEHELQRCVEVDDKYVLLVRWRSVLDHEEGFRRSEKYEDWSRMLHHFYEPFPVVEHYELVDAKNG